MKGAKEFNFEKEYVGAFIDTVRPEVLSYDHYALIYDAKNKKNVLREDYLRNLEVFATYSEKKKIPFYNFLLTLGHLFLSDGQNVCRYRMAGIYFDGIRCAGDTDVYILDGFE